MVFLRSAVHLLMEFSEYFPPAYKPINEPALRKGEGVERESFDSTAVCGSKWFHRSPHIEVTPTRRTHRGEVLTR